MGVSDAKIWISIRKEVKNRNIKMMITGFRIILFNKYSQNNILINQSHHYRTTIASAVYNANERNIHDPNLVP
jgi:hypothetical protein